MLVSRNLLWQYWNDIRNSGTKGSFLTKVIDDFNAKADNWYSHDKTSFESSTIESIISWFILHQLINEPTHLLQNYYSCINLIFTSQANFVVEPGVPQSLHPNCHQQIVFTKFNLKISYPPSYLREVWHYKEANADRIKRLKHSDKSDNGWI